MSRLSELNCLARWIALPLIALSCTISRGDRQPLGETISIGIEGHYRVGRWTGVRFHGDAEIASLETRDGDGVQVEYIQPAAVSANDWAYVIPGSEAAPLVLRSSDEVIASTRFATIGSPSRGPAMIPLKTPWIVVFGDPLGVDQIGANRLLDRDASIAVSKPQDAGGVPDSVLGYDGVDMIMLGGSSSELLATLSENQRQALADWITGGGRVFLTLGQSAPDLMRAAPWLQSLLPIEELRTVKIDPSAIETYTSTQTPLPAFEGAKLPRNKGRILIMGRTTRRIGTPVAVEYNVGFGRITTVAADLENETFAAWPERLDLMTQLTGTILVPEQDEQQQKTRATAYDDLAGQMRTTLDRFAIKRNFGFSIVSLILMALVAAIGPLDFILVNRLLGRPLLGWLSLPLMAIGLSLVLAFQARPVTQAGSLNAGDETLACNRIEIFDIDADQAIGRGFAVSYIYAHDASRFDVEVKPSERLTKISGKMDQLLTTPFGYPGESFGGIQIAIEDGRLPIYQVRFHQPAADNRPATGASLQASTTLDGLPLASRSSKAIATRCRFTPTLTSEASIRRRAGSELLQGELINPLPLDLLDGMLIYRNWTYLLPTRFPAGGRIASVDSLRQKNFRWQLSRQKALESETETEVWDPSANDSPGRIAEMLMFHDAVGGARYTTLRHGPLSFLDLSHLLADDRCILIGKVAGELTNIEATDRDSTQSPLSETLTLVRVVLPVDTSSQR